MKLTRLITAVIASAAIASPSSAKKAPEADPADTPRSWTQLLWEGEAPHSKIIRPDANGNLRQPNEIGDTAKLHISLPAPSKANGKAVVLCPGGGYGHLAMDHEGCGWADFFNNQGIALITLQYRLPEGTWEIPVEDVQEAIRTVRRNAAGWNIRPDAIGIGGSSAGGHLASTAATHFANPVNADPVSCRPDFAILFYPVISLKPEYTHAGSRANLLGPNLTCEREIEFSNELQVTPDAPRTIIFYSSDDNVVHPFNGIHYYNALYNAGVPASIHVYPTGGHGWGCRPDFKYHDTMTEDLSSWLTGF
ncbi:MAG: alpha/beta hydrolase [Bacteroidales bacterium]|nr:alpha/beta hydrolase [Bacteroidales bacterium]